MGRPALLAFPFSLLTLAGCADSSSPRTVMLSSVAARGTPPRGPVGNDGGRVERLLFACVGDTRPARLDDTTSYPIDVIARIYADIEGMSPRPSFVVSTGDYLFASSRRGDIAAAQIDLYMGARMLYGGAFFPAMGNHECTGATVSNCVVTRSASYSAFLQGMLGPIGKTEPYYAVRVDAADASWSTKVVFVAANAWSSAQQTWLERALSEPTTYTFVVRHEPASDTEAPGVEPSEAIMARHPYTLAIVGHDHTYGHYREHPREVIIGNGGAPLSSKSFGFGVFAQTPQGAIVVDMVDWQSGERDPLFHFVVAPDGTW